VPGAAQAPAVAGHDVDVGPRPQDRELLVEELRLPQVVAVEQREELAAQARSAELRAPARPRFDCCTRVMRSSCARHL
jgi:hypothetical protein